MAPVLLPELRLDLVLHSFLTLDEAFHLTGELSLLARHRPLLAPYCVLGVVFLGPVPGLLVAIGHIVQILSFV